MTITKDSFGTTADGVQVSRYTFKNKNDMEVSVLDYGGIIRDIIVPDAQGNMGDVNLGFDTMEGYANRPYVGALIGRVANRIANGKFTLNGKEYSLFVNNGPNSLHGGKQGFDKKLWDAEIQGSKLQLKYVSADGEENYPGEVTLVVTYELTDDNEFILDYTATSTKATPINFTNHAYFNLGGHGSGTIEDHLITLHAEAYLPVDENSIPTGEIRKVEGTEYDLRTPVKLGDRLSKVPGGKGFDNNFVLSNPGSRQLAARAEHPNGRTMECYTTEPGMQFYTSFYIKEMAGKKGAKYGQYGAFCLEAQHYPNSINEPSFPKSVLEKGETYRQTTSYKFGVKK